MKSQKEAIRERLKQYVQLPKDEKERLRKLSAKKMEKIIAEHKAKQIQEKNNE